jgi:hypothetical protein
MPMVYAIIKGGIIVNLGDDDFLEDGAMATVWTSQEAAEKALSDARIPARKRIGMIVVPLRVEE